MARSTRPRRNRLVRETSQKRYQAASEHGLISVLYDFDVIIEILRGRARIVEAATVLEGGGVPTYCTAIAIAEIHAGIRPGEEPQTEAFFEVRGEVGLDGRVGQRAGAYLARYAKSHGVEIAECPRGRSGGDIWPATMDAQPEAVSNDDVTFYEA
jgi:predicted nucleic acid-binding protein